MAKLSTPTVGPDFSKFKKIPPAFAGTIIDWSMGSREITATVIDLILRDHLSVIGTKIVNNYRTLPLKNFEKRFINTIFKKSEALTFEQFSQIAYKNEFGNLLKIIADGMKEEGYVDKDFQEKMTNTIKQTMTAALGTNPFEENPAKLKESNSQKPTVIPVWVFKAFLFFLLLLFILSIFIHEMNFLAFPIFVIGTIIMYFTYFIRHFAKKFTKNLGEGYDWILTVKGRAVKVDCLELKKFMETYPLIEDRLANEMVSFAIAFGLGKGWLKKIGQFNAKLKIFIESLNSQGDTTMLFIDLQKYSNSFELKTD